MLFCSLPYNSTIGALIAHEMWKVFGDTPTECAELVPGETIVSYIVLHHNMLCQNTECVLNEPGMLTYPDKCASHLRNIVQTLTEVQVQGHCTRSSRRVGILHTPR